MRMKEKKREVMKEGINKLTELKAWTGVDGAIVKINFPRWFTYKVC